MLWKINEECILTDVDIEDFVKFLKNLLVSFWRRILIISFIFLGNNQILKIIFFNSIHKINLNINSYNLNFKYTFTLYEIFI